VRVAFDENQPELSAKERERHAIAAKTIRAFAANVEPASQQRLKRAVGFMAQLRDQIGVEADPGYWEQVLTTPDRDTDVVAVMPGVDVVAVLVAERRVQLQAVQEALTLLSDALGAVTAVNAGLNAVRELGGAVSEDD
jgi:hypothetical protein